jgi:ribosomal protein S18 acetylase RimI-like enzyme
MRDRLLEFELELDVATSEKVVDYDWGRAFLSPALPLVWDANWLLIEQPEMTVGEVIAAGEESLAAFGHRTIAVRDEAEGARLGREIAGAPDWNVETTLYMTWQEESGREAGAEVREVSLEDCEDLRRELIRLEFPPEMANVEETTEQLLEMNRRYASAAGDRWFVAPPQQPAAACCLFAGGGIGQIEDVGTLPSARGRGLAQAVTLNALAASREAGHEVTFLLADADDWPRLMYEKLGFRTCGRMHVLRRTPTDGITA